MDTVDRPLAKDGQPKLVVTDPEYTLSIIGLVTSICGQPIVGLVLSIIALKRSKAEGRRNTYGLLAFIFSLIQIGLFIISIILYFVLIFSIVLPQIGSHVQTY